MAMSDSKFHQKELQRHCRVCACIMEDHSRPQFGYRCQEQHNQSLSLKLGVNVMADQPDVHPTHFCHSCRTKASHHLERLRPVPLLHLIDCVDKYYVYVGNCTLYTCTQKSQIENLSAKCGQVSAIEDGPFILVFLPWTRR